MSLTIEKVGRAGHGEFSQLRDQRGAAQEFEALLIGHLLQSAFAESQEGLGSGDASAQSMMDFGREHMARLIAKNGGFGLASMIERALESGAKK